MRLAEWYLLEGLNAFGATIFLGGVYFWTRGRHGFADGENLLLGALIGACHLLVSSLGGRVADRAGRSRAFLAGLAGMSLALAVGAADFHRLGAFLCVALYAASAAFTWPALESAVALAPGAAALAPRMGVYNLVWSLAGAVGFFAAGVLFAWRPGTVFAIPLLVHAAEVAWLAVRERGAALPGLPVDAPSPEAEGAPVTPFGPRLLRAAWAANAQGYFLAGAFSALAPTVGERLGLGSRPAIWLTSAFLFARAAAFLLFRQWEGWHGRGLWIAAALASAPAAVAVAFNARGAVAAFAGLVALGVAGGLAYSASLYYSLSQGGGKGAHGGRHEAVLGTGILGGPLAGAAGILLFGTTEGAQWFVVGLGAAAAAGGLWLLRGGDGAARGAVGGTMRP